MNRTYESGQEKQGHRTKNGEGYFYAIGTVCVQKNTENRYLSPVFTGEPSGIRTPDTLIKSQVLCQLS